MLFEEMESDGPKDGTGEHYDRLVSEFEKAGGDSTACPFDCEDYRYVGPSIRWDGDRPTIVSSEKE